MQPTKLEWGDHHSECLEWPFLIITSKQDRYSEAHSMRFGFLGLGQMGAPMAINLGQQNDVLVYDRNTNAVANVGQRGAKTANAPDQFADVDVLITCLPNAKIVESALFDQKAGLVQHLKAGALVVDTSTIEYSATLVSSPLNSSIDFWFL